MSLINDMLRDLDARRPAAAGHAGALPHSPGLAVAANATLVPVRRLVTATLLVTALAAAGILAWQTLPSHPLADMANPVAAPITAAPPPPVAVVKAPDSVIAAPQHDIAPAPRPVAAKVVEPVLRERPAPPARPVTPKVKAPPKPKPVIAKTLRPLSAETQAQLAYQEAMTLLQQGDNSAGEVALTKALQLDAGYAPARLALAGLLIKQQQSADAEALLREGIARNPGAIAEIRLLGHLLMEQGRDMDARAVLERGAMHASRDADYQGLLGTLYQRMDEPALAAERYRRAVLLRNNNGVWWLGLGIVSEQTGDTATAIEAFARAWQLPLGKPLQEYVTARLRALQ